MDVKTKPTGTVFPSSLRGPAAAPEPRDKDLRLPEPYVLVQSAKDDAKKLSTDDEKPSPPPPTPFKRPLDGVPAAETALIWADLNRLSLGRSPKPPAAKYAWVSSNQQISGTFPGSVPTGSVFESMLLIGAVTGGVDSDILRNGTYIRVRSVSLRWRVNADPGPAGLAPVALDIVPPVRCVVWRDKMPISSVTSATWYTVYASGTSMTDPTALLITPGTQNVCIAQRNPSTRERYHVYYDKTATPKVTFASAVAAASVGNYLVSGGTPVMEWNHTFEGGGFITQYASTAASSTVTNDMYLGIMTDQINTGANNRYVVYWDFRVYWDDLPT